MNRIVRKGIAALGFTAAVVILILWLAGAFHAKLGTAGPLTPQATGRPVGNTPLAEVRLIRVPTVEPAVGTIRAVHETAVASKLLAKVKEVNIQAGQAVRAGEVMMRLDDEDLQAKLRQAEAALAGAEAAREQAGIELRRTRQLAERGSASQIELDRAETAVKAANAEMDHAEQSRREAATVLEYATIRAPMDGQVVDKRVQVGDTAAPGQVLATFYDPTRMQLVASVRESLTYRLKVGEVIGVQVDALGRVCEGKISEIVPEAESASRSFQVKVTGPCPPGIYSGMFGRLLIPLDEREVLVIPSKAIQRVGQLELVDVAEAGTLMRRAVRLGRPQDDDVEVLSGLRTGERVALPAAPPTSMGSR